MGKTAKKYRGIVNGLTIFGVHIILYIIYAKYGEVFMEAYKVIEIKKSVFESNDREAEKLRAELKAENHKPNHCHHKSAIISHSARW